MTYETLKGGIKTLPPLAGIGWTSFENKKKRVPKNKYGHFKTSSINDKHL